MGYYSEVRAVVYGEDKDKLQALITKYKLSDAQFFDALFFEQYELSNEQRSYSPQRLSVAEFCHDNVKFYEDSKYVQEFRQMLLDAANVFDLNYEFVRVGENYDDIECSALGKDVQGLLQVKTEVLRDLGSFRKLKETDSE